MKHLGILQQAGLVVVRRVGRERWNHLNAVPIQQVYEAGSARTRPTGPGTCCG